MSHPTSPPLVVHDAADAVVKFRALLQRQVTVIGSRTDECDHWYLPTALLPPEVIDGAIEVMGLESLWIDSTRHHACLVATDAVARYLLKNLDRPPMPGLPPPVEAPINAHTYAARRVAQISAHLEDCVTRGRQSLDATITTLLPPKEVAPGLLSEPARAGPEETEHALVKKAAIEQRLKELTKSESTMRVRIENLQKVSTRALRGVTGGDLRQLATIAPDFPHFRTALDSIRRQLLLQRATQAPLVLKPLLLVGPPGVGKTAFMRRLGMALQLSLLPIQVSTLSAGWLLQGQSSGWRNASPGLIAQALIRTPPKQGLLVQLDEIDKLPFQQSYPVEPTLLDLLEPEQSGRFRDEYFELEMDLRPLLSIIATANDLSRISAPLRSRFEIVEIGLPTAAQLPAVLRSVDRELRHENPGFNRVFSPLSDDCLSVLASVDTRAARSTLIKAYGLALETAGRGKRRLTADLLRAALPTAPATTPNQSHEDDEAMLLILRRGGPGRGGAPPGAIVH